MLFAIIGSNILTSILAMLRPIS